MRVSSCLALVSLVLCSAACSTTSSSERTVPASPRLIEAELAAARALFDRNLRAIQDKDKDAYLACYRQDERLVRAGGEGVALGFAELAEGTAATGSDEWPERLEADDVQVHWIAPGVVYGAYRYRVTIAGVTTTGLSERVFLRDGDSWRIAVSTAFEAPTPPTQGTSDEPAPPETQGTSDAP